LGVPRVVAAVAPASLGAQDVLGVGDVDALPPGATSDHRLTTFGRRSFGDDYRAVTGG